MNIRAALAHWYGGRDLSRVEVVRALWQLPVIRPEKPQPQRPKIRSFGEWVRYQEQGRKIA